MRLYGDLATWFHLLTAPEDYAAEAGRYRDLILGALPDAKTLLELGSGGGNNASHLKADFACTLSDVSPQMLDLSRRLNPECEHVLGDMEDGRARRDSGDGDEAVRDPAKCLARGTASSKEGRRPLECVEPVER